MSNRSVVSVVGTSPVSSSRIAQSNGRSVAPVDAASSAPCRRSSSVKLGGSLVGAAGAGGRTFPTPRGCATGPVGVGAGAGACEPVARPSQSTSLRPWPKGSARRRSSSTARFSAARSSRWRIAVGSEIEDGCEAVLVGGTGAAGGIRSPSVSRSCSTAACGFSEGSRSSVSIRIACVAPASSGSGPAGTGDASAAAAGSLGAGSNGSGSGAPVSRAARSASRRSRREGHSSAARGAPKMSAALRRPRNGASGADARRASRSSAPSAGPAVPSGSRASSGRSPVTRSAPGRPARSPRSRGSRPPRCAPSRRCRGRRRRPRRR